MTYAWDESVSAYAAAAAAFVRLTGAVGDRWDDPALGEWDVRALVGHTTRAFLTVEAYLQKPAARVEIGSAADYYRATRSIAAGPDVAERGRDAGRALGHHPVSAVGEIGTRVLALVGTKDGTELLTTIAGGMRLSDYLPTRTFELAVHGADLASALDVPFDLPAPAAAQALHLVEELAVADDRAAPLLLAATGRRALPPGFSLL